LTAADNLAASLSGQGKYDEAKKMEREVLAVRKRVLGAEHADTLTAAGNLARSLNHQGKYDEAVAMEREVLAVRKRVLGADHPHTWLQSLRANEASTTSRAAASLPRPKSLAFKESKIEGCPNHE
jgi:tetratricopeptide (TPR) repeat protein